MQKILFLTMVGFVWFASCKEANTYKLELNYVALSDGTEVSAQPVKKEDVSLDLIQEGSLSFKVELDSIIHQNLSGIGGAFNEMGGDAFVSLSEENQAELSNALFNTENGSGLSNCRTAVGASDFGLSAYSYSEVPEDYKMEHFSIAREQANVIPFLHAAYKENPELKMFASPWSPPGWMKESGIMDGGAANAKENVLKYDPKIYEAYALYFEKYIKAYKENGININRLLIQNETDMNPTYPGCDMPPEQMAELVSKYIGPKFKNSNLDTELWAGTFRGKRKDAQKFMTLDGAKDVQGVGLQYAPSSALRTLRKNYPGIKIMHTEGRCENGKNSMEQARKRFSEVASWINSGSENFCYWNIVLNETSTSGWGWKQNSLINIDRDKNEITYNSDYAPISLLSQFIRPGDQSVKVVTPEKKKAIAVKNANRIVVFIENMDKVISVQTIELAGKKYNVQLPAESLCAFVFNTN